MDWRDTLDFDSVVAGCDVIFHLGAELEDVSLMPRINVDATRALAQAAERAQTRLLLYVSSASVYGSSKQTRVDENTPVLTDNRDVKSEYWVGDTLRAYARSKLQGERAIFSVVKNLECVVVRPTVVVNLDEIRRIGDWSWKRRILQGNARTHHLYVGDFSHALLWLAQRATERDARPGHIEIFNLSDEDHARNTHSVAFNQAYLETGDRRYLPLPAAPMWLDTWRNIVQRAVPPGRHPFGAMRISSQKLYSAGYTHKFGVNLAQSCAWKGMDDL